MQALKPQDVVVALKLVGWQGSAWTYPSVAAALHMSASAVHESVQRLAASRLYEGRTLRQVVKPRLLEFLVHGVPYAFPAELGVPEQGLPTAMSTPALAKRLMLGPGDQAVWAWPEGPLVGRRVEPLYRNVPRAALEDARLHEALALVDALRVGRAREKAIAAKELEHRLSA